MKKKNSGFTLVELMIALSVAAVIASIALWDSSDVLEENRAENFLLELKRNISYARSQAASTDEIVVICPAPQSNVKNAKSTLECKTNRWDGARRIIMFIDGIGADGTRDGNYDETDDSLLRVMDQLNENDALSFSGEKFIRFNTSGRITSTPGDFIYCPGGDDENNKALTLSQSGTAFYAGNTNSGC
ncbi:GspH/FimT family pseudopilin [Pseudoalteromonas sp. MMG010]|uniref:GspH/FimT family pseudopilin n=1 Tax=Pseudoalteromonas sp. MMG010 TaxID=2822685 RepID=UPI001B3A59D0|nr:GspH/FimT family pseudopilin [Pseudoalteromonas sp. MMG010]MBQ4833057.1 GspH/FimT family pseudopilin [Pseudoalteromonas sp. MMG010]